VIIHHEPRPDGSRQMPEVGMVIPAHASALGKAILAFTGPDGRPGGKSPLRSMTGETITSREALEAELKSVRGTGLADEAEEALLGECGVAAPVFDAHADVAGAIGVVVPSAAWPVDQAVCNAVREAARAISRELGAPGWPARAGTG
jgi:DNA-binding IclR family transcriptional regulator